jgi:hypothetical protein
MEAILLQIVISRINERSGPPILTLRDSIPSLKRYPLFGIVGRPG